MTTLLEHLQDQGYDPSADNPWFDLTASGIGTVRVAIDDGTVYVYYFDGGMICEWDAWFSPGVSAAVILAAIKAAEDELAARRGGPVTPAQAEAKAARDA